MNNFLLWVGGLLVVLLCAMFGVPHFIDWNGYRGAFEEEASRILGREVRVAGRVNLRILPTPFVRFEKVRLSDAEGVTGEPFFRADDFTLWLAPGALLRGTLEANRVELHRPILKLRLNASGGGNWQTFSLNSGSLPFVLSDVALQSVSLSDGAISIDGADGTELARIDSIGGEVTAASLTGPFKFRGQANWNDEARALRLSTAAPETDGSTRFKLNIAVPKTSNSYVLDGRLSDWSTSPKLDGTLSGSLRIAEGVKIDAQARRSPAADAPVPIEMTAQITGDVNGVNLADIGLAFDQDGGKPQSLTGQIAARFQGERRIEANLTSRWLDIDRILGWTPNMSDAAAMSQSAGQPTGNGARVNGSRPLAILRQMSAGLASLMPSSLPARVTITADSVTLAGDAVNSVRFGLERTGDQLRLKEFRAGFPGSTRVEATGLFPSAADPAAFEGDVVLRGANLGRFLNWAGLSAGADGRNDGAFSLRSLLVTTAQSVSFRDITADLSGTVIGGSFQDDWSKRRQVDMKLEGSTIDLSNLAPGSLDFRAWRSRQQKVKTSAPVAEQSDMSATVGLPHFLHHWLDPSEGDLNVQIRVGRLMDGSQDLRDVAINASMANGRLSLSNLHFQSAAGQTATGQTGSGLDVEAEGEVSDVNGQPTGTMRGWVTAQDGTAIAQLMTLLGLSSETTGGTGHARLLAPSRVAWTARFGNNRVATGSQLNTSNVGTINSSPGASSNAPATAVDVTLDGALLGRRLMAVLRLDGGIDDWRNAPLDATITLDGPDFPRLVQLLGLDEYTVGTIQPTPPTDSKAEQFGQGRLSAKIVGRSAADIMADIRFNDDGIDWSFAGRASALPGGLLNADGEIRVTAVDLERAVAQVGFGRNASLANVVVDGSVDLFVKDGTVRVASRGLTLNSVALLGDIAVTPASGPAPRRVLAKLKATDASVPRLLDLLLDPRGAKKTAAATDDIVWSKVPFDLTRLGNLEGHVRLEAGNMMLSQGLALKNAVLEAKIDNGRVDITALDGTAVGGRLASKWSLTQAKTGVIVAGSMTLAGTQLRLLADPAHPPTSQPPLQTATRPNEIIAAKSGEADVAITLSGQGASPAAVISTLTGRGILDVHDGQILGTSPSNVKSVIDGVMAGKIDLTAEALERAIHKASSTGVLRLGTRKIDIAVIDGAVRLAPLTVATDDGVAANRTTVDLTNFKFDIEWRLDITNLQAAATLAGEASDTKLLWPSVSIVQLGHLGEPELSVQRSSVQALARELTVRKMERDVADLERLRRLDEDRIRIETERLKGAETDKMGPAAATSPQESNLPLGQPSAAVGPTPTVRIPSETNPASKDSSLDPAVIDAKRRAADRSGVEPRRSQPAARKFDPFQSGTSP
jgi:uncharacterized protein involved in outer membrane biogenesis